MNEELIEHQIETLETRVNAHSTILDRLEQDNIELKIEIKNLCENLKNLTSILKWFIGVWLTTLIGFFVSSIK